MTAIIDLFVPEYDANEPDWEALPVIDCARCGATVHADFPNDRYCLDCDVTVEREQAAADRDRCRAIEAETLSRDLSEVPF